MRIYRNNYFCEGFEKSDLWQKKWFFENELLKLSWVSRVSTDSSYPLNTLPDHYFFNCQKSIFSKSKQKLLLSGYQFFFIFQSIDKK